MPYSIELLLDEDASLAVRRAWGKLAEARCGDYMLANGVYPHLALTVCDEALPPIMLSRLVGGAVPGGPLTLSPGSVDRFESSASVVFLGFEATGPLAALHGAVMVAAGELGLDVHPLYQAGAWRPHVTLAMDVPPERLDEAIALATAVPWPARMTFDRLAIVSHPPTRLRWSARLN